MSDGDPENGDVSENPEPEADSEFSPYNDLTVEDERGLNQLAGTDQPEDELCNLNDIPSNNVNSGNAEHDRPVEEQWQNHSYSDAPEGSDCNSNDSTPVHRPVLLSNLALSHSPNVSNNSTPVHVLHSSGQQEHSVSGSDNEGNPENSDGGELIVEACDGGGSNSDGSPMNDDANAAPEDEVLDTESAASTAGSIVEDTPECDQGIGAEAHPVCDSWRTNTYVSSDMASLSNMSAADSCESSNSLSMATESCYGSSSMSQNMLSNSSENSSSVDLSNISVKELLLEEISDDDEEEMLNFKKNISDMVNTCYNTSHSVLTGNSPVPNNSIRVSEHLLHQSVDVVCDSLNPVNVEQSSADSKHIKNVKTQEVPDLSDNSTILDKSCDNCETTHISVKVNSKTSDPPSEDDLLSELDAELQTHSKESNDPTAILPLVAKIEQTEVQSSSSVQCPGVLSRSFQESSSPPNGLKVTDSDVLKTLQSQLSHMQIQLEESDSKYKSLSEQHTKQSDELDLMTRDRDRYHSQMQAMKDRNPDDLYIPQIKELEHTIAQQQNELKVMKDRLSSHDVAAKRAVNTLQNELKFRIEQITKMYEDCLREKDSMVVKYAESEQKNTEIQKIVEKLENKLRDATKERESLVIKIKACKADKQKAVGDYESKCSEVSAACREIEKLRENLSSMDVRIKWAQNKLRAELEAHKETKTNLETTNKRLKEAKEETQQIRRDCQSMIKTYQESEEIKSNTLDKELKLKESELIVQRQEWSDREELYFETKKNFEALNAQHKNVIEEIEMLKKKVIYLEDEKTQNEGTMSEYKEIMQRQKGENKDLQTKEHELTVLREDFNRAQEMIKTLDKDISDLMVTNKDLVSDMEGCRCRESELLDLTEKLSRKNAKLQSDNTNLNNQVALLTGEAEHRNMEIQQLETRVRDLSETLADEKQSLQEEIECFKTQLLVKTKDVEKFKQCFEDEKDVVRTLKKRHVNNVKDLTRQLQQARKRLEALENHNEKDVVSMGSRTSSTGSLNTVDRENSVHTTSNHSSNANSRAPSQEQEYPVITEQVEVDKHVLVERIVRLQKAHARKNEKLEFLEDHIQQLLVEIQKKTKIIQNYFMREEAGTLAPDYMDENKALLAKKGGIMASVYSSHQQDGHLTLELSLEINKKLQGVLEDTILKNITLKDNIDTLGTEISRLSQENRQLQLHMQGIKS